MGNISAQQIATAQQSITKAAHDVFNRTFPYNHIFERNEAWSKRVQKGAVRRIQGDAQDHVFEQRRGELDTLAAYAAKVKDAPNGGYPGLDNPEVVNAAISQMGDIAHEAKLQRIAAQKKEPYESPYAAKPDDGKAEPNWDHICKQGVPSQSFFKEGGSELMDAIIENCHGG